MQSVRRHEPVPSIKQVGANGQISLGKEFAGQTVQVEQSEPGVWLVRTVMVIPTNEAYLHTPEARESLQNALGWAVEHPPADTDLTRLFGEKANGKGATKQTARKRPSKAG